MKLINADKYKKDIEHYRNTICYQRNVTMDDCMRILDKQEDAFDKIRAEITAIVINGQVDEHTMFIRTGEYVKQMALEIIDRYMEGESSKIIRCSNCGNENFADKKW